MGRLTLAIGSDRLNPFQKLYFKIQMTISEPAESCQSPVDGIPRML
jgi:hypothetical protein